MTVDEACSRRRLLTLTNTSEKPAAHELMLDDIAEVVAKRTHIPIEVILASDDERLLQLEPALLERVIGQEPWEDPIPAPKGAVL